jgi:hypothetical protein
MLDKWDELPLHECAVALGIVQQFLFCRRFLSIAHAQRRQSTKLQRKLTAKISYAAFSLLARPEQMLNNWFAIWKACFCFIFDGQPHLHAAHRWKYRSKDCI